MCSPTPARTAAAAAAERRPSEPRLRGARILLAEDNEINQQIAIELLEGAGATVQVANNGREAVENSVNGPQPPPFDVVLMDLQMPEMDGYQATAKIRSDARFATLPIIAMTAHATMEERQRCLAAGMNDHISKPIDPGAAVRDGPPLLQAGRRCGLGGQCRSAGGPDRGGADARGPPPVPHVSDGQNPLVAEGVDTEDGLRRVGGNRKLYLKLLRDSSTSRGRPETRSAWRSRQATRPSPNGSPTR